jgi:hypothetical protein
MERPEGFALQRNSARELEAHASFGKRNSAAIIASCAVFGESSANTT